MFNGVNNIPFCNKNYPAQPFLLNGYGMLVKKLTPKKGSFWYHNYSEN